MNDFRTEEETLDALGEQLRLAPPLPSLPAGLRERTLYAVAAAKAREGEAKQPTTDSRGWRRALGLVGDAFSRSSRTVRVAGVSLATAAAVAVVAFNLAAPDGELQLEGKLVGDGKEALVEVREVGEGRTVQISSSSLPVLPKGGYYEVWFVGPGDSPGSPNRVSAGTFHPDPEGNTDTTLFGAVNPDLLPRIEITVEPADGDPAPSGDVVVSRD